MTQVLVVDDEPHIRSVLRGYLESDGHVVSEAVDGETALDLLRRDRFDLVLLDVMMPGVDGLEVLRRLRATSDVYVILVTARTEEVDKLVGLGVGADDYITKPFSPREVAARVKAVLRRSAASGEQDETLRFPGLIISLKSFEVTYDSRPVQMPPKELELLHFLASHQNQVFTREQLLEKVWGFDYFGDSRTVDVHVKRLREKLQDSERFSWTIKTVWSIGYKFEVK